MANELGEFLEKLRGKRSLREVAEKSGLSHTYIRDLELGVNRVSKTPIRPTPETISKLAEAYNYSYEELMAMAGYMERIINDQTKNDAMEKYTRLPQEDQEFIDEMIKSLYEKRKQK